MAAVIRLVPKPRRSLLKMAGTAYFNLLVGLLVAIAGMLFLTIAATALGI